jgi:hypothetical protein
LPPSEACAEIHADLAAVRSRVELRAGVEGRGVLDREQSGREAVSTIARVAAGPHQIEARLRVELDHERRARDRDEAAVLRIEHVVFGRAAASW